MRAIVSTPKGAQPTEIREVAEPQPAANEAVIAVQAFALNRGELSLLPNRDGWQPGQDVAGTIARAAADGSGPPVGARVAALVDQGGWAERVAGPTERIAPLPDGVDMASAAALPIAGLTALRALRQCRTTLARRVLITGASGGVGHLAVQLAAVGGAIAVTAIARAERSAALLASGATEVVARSADARSGPYDVVVDSVGGDDLTQAVRMLAPGAAVAIFGASSGERGQIGFADLRLAPNCRVMPFRLYESGPGLGRDLAALLELVAREKLHPTVGHTADWNELPAALAALRARAFSGKAVLRIG
jgi:NADPH:quinone reductase-like Zn-dependent oxidoreductase